MVMVCARCYIVLHDVRNVYVIFLIYNSSALCFLSEVVVSVITGVQKPPNEYHSSDGQVWV